ncbi:Uma2 family endonuclease [Desulfofundulus thermocisternus]|uniref:Uma2 family endonuclease n=1 Tax=Desulfofundulus thermocisternus TaxID=42471 RepID=UPI0019ED8096|nr:Uma2 family endonuclease [Desulfofundulus thermocisternus]MBE3588748.1 Uma2 family endonuclease [Thermoanaerobacteraceae bacterium]MCS5695717.1 Uma2 family endonuclease [Desulfofundulus thermocisternus]
MLIPENLKFTYEDYLLLPEDKRYEIIGGDIFMTPSPKRAHQKVSRNLTTILWSYVKDHALGEVYEAPFDVLFGQNDVVQPDIMFVARNNLSIIGENNIQGAPDLIIEILSPSSAERDLFLKKKLYARHAVKEYWIVDPGARTVTVNLWQKNEYIQTGVYGEEDTWRPHLLPGLIIEGKEVFA